MSATATVSETTAPSRGLHWGLWVAQGLLAALFLLASVMKLTTPLPDLAAMMPYVADTGSLVRFIGFSELLGAIGLILPSALRIAPILTPIAASLLGVVMVLAIGMHVSYGEAAATPVNAVILAMAAFVAWGRFKGAPIPSR